MTWHALHILTYFGDSMLLLPTALIMAVLIRWKQSSPYAVWFWLLTFGSAGVIVSLSKIAFLGFGLGIPCLDFTGFSGHSTMSATLWPVVMWLLSGRFSPGWRRLAIVVGYLIPLLVGLSRLLLNAHSISEVIAGLILGFTFSSAFLLSQRRMQPQGFTLLQFGVAMLVPLLLFGQGRVATTQQFLQHLSVKIAGIEHPWTRQALQTQCNPPR